MKTREKRLKGSRDKSGYLVLSLLNIGGVDADFFVILFESSEIFTGLREFTFLHTLTDVPVDEGTLGVEEIELVVETAPGAGDGGGVGKHAHTARHLGKVTARNVSRWLIADTELEASGTPVDKLDGTLGLDDGDCSIDIRGDDITTVEESASH